MKKQKLNIFITSLLVLFALFCVACLGNDDEKQTTDIPVEAQIDSTVITESMIITAPEQTSDIAESEQSEAVYKSEMVEERANKLTYFPSPDGKNAVIVEELPDLDANVWHHYLNDFTQPLCDIYFYGLAVDMGIAQTIWLDNEKVLLPGGILYNTADNSQKRIGRDSTEQIELYPDIFIPITEFPLTNMYPLPDGSGVLAAESCWFNLKDAEYHSWEGTAILKYDYTSDTLTCLDVIRHELSDGIYVQYWPMKADGNNVKIYLSYRVQDVKKNEYLPYTYLYTYDTAREELIKEKLNYDIEWDLGDAGRIVSFDRYKETLQDSSLADGSCLLDADTGEIKAQLFIDWHIWNEEVYCKQQQDALYCDYKLYYVDDSLNELVCYDIEKDELTVIDDNKMILPNGSAAFYLKDSRDIEGWRFDVFEENGSFFVFEYCSFWDQKTDEEYAFYNKYQLVLEGESQ